MNNLLIILIIGICLSMDAFSIAIAIGITNITKRKKIVIALVIGIYHFIMPLLGNLIGDLFLNNLLISSNLIISLILILIGINILIGIKKEDSNSFNLSSLGIIILGLGVSIDSFGTGIGINLINNNIFIPSIIFSIISFLITYLGLSLGFYLNKIIGNLSNLIGGIILISLGIYYLIF